MKHSIRTLSLLVIMALVATPFVLAQSGPGDCTGPVGTGDCTGPVGTGGQGGPGAQGVAGGPGGQGGGSRGHGGHGGWGGDCCCSAYVSSLPAGSLSEAEAEGLVYVREEEKLARDVYLGLALRWTAVPAFDRIARAEQRHMNAVAQLLERYSLVDPVGDNDIGVFSDVRLQLLYDELFTRGKASLEDALLVGATIEDLDIFDVEQLVDETDNADLATVYQNLLKGSRNHIRTFAMLLQDAGVEYSGQYLSDYELDLILGSDWERGVVYDENGEVAGPCGRGQG